MTSALRQDGHFTPVIPSLSHITPQSDLPTPEPLALYLSRACPFSEEAVPVTPVLHLPLDLGLPTLRSRPQWVSHSPWKVSLGLALSP